MTNAKCFACTGTGHRPCTRCGGSGRSEFNPWEVPLKLYGDCDLCKGTGRSSELCPICNGTGVAVEQTQI